LSYDDQAESPENQHARKPQNAPLDPGLYLVATPIGNLEDITLRALRVLKGVDRIACEDTRLTQKLLNYFGISTPTISCHEHNEQARTVELLALLQQGGRVAVVSDAGMPAISDPGLELVRAAVAAGVPVIPVPGANAALSALIASGLDTDRFLYVGFLAAKPSARRAQLEALAARMQPGEAPLTLAVYEAPHRILETLADVEAVWGESVRVVIARELTKLHEEFLRGTAVELRVALAARERIRGEIVLLIEARPPAPQTKTGGSIAQQVSELIETAGLDEKDALKRLARERGVSKSEVYRELQRERRTGTPPGVNKPQPRTS
jgi:16S rRNA (cytidine1402-2'-O)-methyltransferase